MDGPRDLSYQVKPVRVKAKDDIQGESINSSRELIHKLRQTHRRRNTSVQFLYNFCTGKSTEHTQRTCMGKDPEKE